MTRNNFLLFKFTSSPNILFIFMFFIRKLSLKAIFSFFIPFDLIFLRFLFSYPSHLLFFNALLAYKHLDISKGTYHNRCLLVRIAHKPCLRTMVNDKR